MRQAPRQRIGASGYGVAVGFTGAAGACGISVWAACVWAASSGMASMIARPEVSPSTLTVSVEIQQKPPAFLLFWMYHQVPVVSLP